MKYGRQCLARAICGACLLLTAAAVLGANTIEDGIAAYAAGNYKTAIEQWQALIKEGRPEGLFFLGVMYAEGKGLEKNHVKAFELYSEAAQKDHVPAQYNLGNQYATGEGVTQDFSKAEYWWTKAAEGGLLVAQVTLGDFYYYGVAGEKNPALARKWLILAAQQGSADARTTLARLDAEAVQTARLSTQSSGTATPPRTTGATGTSADALRREAWVLAQPSSYYTIQILATNTDAHARDYIHQHDLSGRAAYIETSAQGAAVFRIAYGSYANRSLADKALAALPSAISANSPWVRTFAELHKLVDRRYAERGTR